MVMVIAYSEKLTRMIREVTGNGRGGGRWGSSKTEEPSHQKYLGPRLLNPTNKDMWYRGK